MIMPFTPRPPARRAPRPALTLCALAACAAEPPPRVLSFDEFAATASVERDTGFRIIDGDDVVSSDADLRARYDGYLATVRADRLAAAGLGEHAGALIVDAPGGIDNLWTSAEALNLAYCIDQASMGDFGAADAAARYDATITAMKLATAAWQGVAAVNFVYLPQLDGRCTTPTASLFTVRRVDAKLEAPPNGYIARSPYPHTPPATRTLSLDHSAYTLPGPITLTGVLTHELGHMIGFLHEHIRLGLSGPLSCFAPEEFRALTAYDSASVMHYPNCGGTNTGDLVLTALDQAGAALAYPRGTYPRLLQNDPRPWFAFSQTVPFTGTSKTTGREGPWAPVLATARSFDRGPVSGPLTVGFSATWSYPSGPTTMELDVRLVVDGLAGPTQRMTSSQINLQLPLVRSGVHDVRVDVRSVLASGPPVAVTLSGAPAVMTVNW